MKFNEKIIRLRKIKGITQDELASAVGVSRQAVYKWECGQSYPEVAKLIEIKLLFNISIDDLLDDSFEIALPEKKKRKRQAKTSVQKTVSSTEKDDEKMPETSPTLLPAEAAPVTEDSSALAVTEQKPVIEDTPAVKKATATVTAPSETQITESAPAEAQSQIREDVSLDSVKKSGFFGRLFGRK